MLEVAFTGALGTEPELKTSAGGKPYCNVAVAIANGEQTVWLRVACFGEVAQDFAGRAHKGDRLAIEGRLTLNSYTAKDGSARTGFNVVASYVRLVEIGRRRPSRERRQKITTADVATPSRAVPTSGRGDLCNQLDDEVPF
jgi:single-strand DNA-binding protein